jgi:Protein of unknown function (DUF1549)/Protein of unknown function (DUF1553)
MRHILSFALALAPVLLFAAEKQVCPINTLALRSPRQAQAATIHSLSVAAESVAPSKPRAVGRPGGTTPPVVNFIDSDLFSAMTAAGIAPTTVAGDEEFLRRVSLDLTGQIPDAATVTAFVNDTTTDKRSRKVDELLASDAFVDRWTMWLGDLVQNVQVSSATREFPQGRNAYYTYIHDSIKANKPYDQMVRELISGKGDSFANGNANFWVRQIQNNGPIQDTYDNLAAQSGDKFLGMPMLCLSCHNGLGHLDTINVYLKSKFRYDFWGNAAFFARTRATRSLNDPNVPNVYKFDVEDNNVGAYQLNTTSGNKTPRTPVNGSSTVSPVFMLTGEAPRTGETYRDAYGRVLTANPQFARAAVNYLWKEMFGLGIVEPTNAFDLSRLDPNNLPAGWTLLPTNAQLLNDLTSEFTKDGYNVRTILRIMATSNAYQLSTVYTPGSWNEAWATYFPRHLTHRLMAEEMLDAITKATSVPVTFTVSGGFGQVTQAMKLPDTLEARNNNYGRFLDEFGRGDRDTTARTNDTSIAQALSLMNDQNVVVNRVHRATAGSGVAKILASTTDPGTIATQLYLNTLSRRPTNAEWTQAVSYLESGTLAQKTEDLQWVLINSLEFQFD